MSASSRVTIAAALPISGIAAASPPLPKAAKALPLADVYLLPSPYFDAVTSNRRYLLSLEPDRLLHNFLTSAGLPPKGEVYGGWEKDTIAGHTLGHYLTALSLLHAQTGDEEACRRANYIVGELGRAQRAHGDGYVGGFTRKRKDGSIVDGKEIFAELMRGDIRALPFDLNGCWVPWYNWHKLFSGLSAAQQLCGIPAAREIAIHLAEYIGRVFAALSDEQVQAMLACEHGGINESFADLYADTRDPRWLALAERIYHHAVLNPLAAQRNELANLHANTQVPKLIGLARIFELNGKPAHAAAAHFFWQAVTRDHSYAIGGNSDREYFQAPGMLSKYITEQTCEGCNTYNMLKLTRHLFAWQPDGALFDYYERAHLNHILAQQNPATGRFTYMTPLMSGIAREFSEPTDSFWCCVGSGMESHAKHGDSIWWEGDDTLFVNLYIPSRAQWQTHNASWEMRTRYPYDGRVDLKLTSLAESKTFALALRIPSWAGDARISVNGRSAYTARESGYALLRRHWRRGDLVTLHLPVSLRMEATPGDDGTVAFLHGPMVLAADLGGADKPFDPVAPALVGDDLPAGFSAVNIHEAVYATKDIARPADLRFSPFYKNYERRSAVYFRRYSEAGWQSAQTAFAAEQAKQKDLAARSVDVIRLGEEAAEKEHGLTSGISYPVVYRLQTGRDARTGGFFAFRMKVRPGPLTLQVRYWGDERKRHFHILIDGTRIATQKLEAERPGEFFDIDYPIAEELTRGKTSVLLRFDPEPGRTAGPAFGCRIFASPASVT